MATSRSLEIVDEPTPKPASAVSPIPSEGSAEAPRRDAARTVHLLDYFANPSPLTRTIDAAWEKALALYGDEDSDAWITALEDGTHPLCGVKSA